MAITFGEKLMTLRKEKRLTQKQLATIMNLSLRTIQNYEKGCSFPKQTEIYARMAAFFNVSIDYLIAVNSYQFADIEKRKPNSKEIKHLIVEIGGLFTSSEISEEHKDMIIQAINNLYWGAKSKRYGGTVKNKFLPDETET